MQPPFPFQDSASSASSKPTSPLPSTAPLSAPIATPSNPPTNEDIEAIIQAATSASQSPFSALRPPRDTRTQLFVGNLPYRVRWQDLKDLFRRAGTVLRADVSLAPDNRSRGYGTVLLASAEDAGRAIDMFNGFVWQTRTLEVRHDKLGVNGGEDPYGVGAVASGLSGGVGLGGAVSANGSGAGTPFSQVLPGPSSLLSRYPSTTAPPSSLAIPEADPCALAPHFDMLSSPLPSALGGRSSPLPVHSPLLGQISTHSTGASQVAGERSRNLFVGNLPFHVQWQDLKDLFRQAGTIQRADVALGPDGRSRGFGTVSFATEMDADRAVRMFNGYEFNGRQLKVHFDKFSAPSSTALPLVNPHSAPHSPHPLSNGFSMYQSAPLAQGANYAQQMMLQQGQNRLRDERSPPRSQLEHQSSHFGLHRSITDSQHPFRYQQSSEEASIRSGPSLYSTGFDPPGTFSRAKSDSVQQMSQRQHPRPDSNQPQPSPMHISLPPYHPLYSFDFSVGSGPGSPYDIYQFNTSAAEGSQLERIGFQSNLEAEVMQPGNVLEAQREQRSELYAEDPADSVPRPSTSPTPAPTFNPPPRTSSHSYSQSESYSSPKVPAQMSHSQDQSQATSPVPTSPANSIHSNNIHPAHPGHISLPPPPPANAFHGHPPHAMQPLYHPQMSPYVSPLHHPSVMMGVMMTPHGLPPITPSMPSFTFLPQPSPSVPAPPPNPESNGPMSAQKASPVLGSNEQHNQIPGSFVAHLQHTHIPAMSPYSPFSPGVAMSPGAFWGRPGTGANPYINPAVGAPVHNGYFPPVQQRQPEEPQGYFPPFTPSGSSRPSGLSNEIHAEQGSTNGSAEDAASVSAHYGEAYAEYRPTSSHSATTATGTTDASSHSNAPSSRGTSWNADSNDSPPMNDILKGMSALDTSDGNSYEAQSKPRAKSTGAHPGPVSSLEAVAPLVRGESDPTQGGATASRAGTQHMASRFAFDVRP